VGVNAPVLGSAASLAQEILVADPIEHTIRCCSRTGTGHLVLPDLSDMSGVDLREPAAQIRWC